MTFSYKKLKLYDSKYTKNDENLCQSTVRTRPEPALSRVWNHMDYFLNKTMCACFVYDLAFLIFSCLCYSNVFSLVFNEVQT